MRRLAAYFLSMSIVLIILILLDFGIFLGENNNLIITKKCNFLIISTNN